MRIKLIFLMLFSSVVYSECADTKDFKIRVTNQTLIKNPPEKISDFNIIFDLEVRSAIETGVFVNIAS
jgi:hypothetical protein